VDLSIVRGGWISFLTLFRYTVTFFFEKSTVIIIPTVEVDDRLHSLVCFVCHRVTCGEYYVLSFLYRSGEVGLDGGVD